MYLPGTVLLPALCCRPVEAMLILQWLIVGDKELCSFSVAMLAELPGVSLGTGSEVETSINEV